jgi:kynurenine formamidase
MNAAASEWQTMGSASLVDLSLPLEDGMITYPSPVHVPFEASVRGRIPVEGRETRRFTMGSHCGTHIDAMRHFLPGGATVDQLPLEQLVGPAILIDLGQRKPASVIEKDELAPHLTSGSVERVVLRTDWSRFWGTRQYYTDWPSLSRACTRYLIERGLRLLALDWPSPDPAYFGEDCSLDCPNHKLLFERNIVLAEYLTNLDKLPPGEIFLIVAPLKLMGFDGAPARIMAKAS